ncbi:MAG: response regulator transcription factor [Defluviitaleaceae bacterium]|nr:response regulator transcription factor [Defluviitaleaceae bacterium]
MSHLILCIEDNIQVQMFNKPLLEDNGYRVETAMTLAEARKAVAEEIPSLIVLDIHLPDGNGLDFLCELRAGKAEFSAIPVIALTDNTAEQDIVTGLTSGCDDYMPKPYTFAILKARIEVLLRRMARAQAADKLEAGPITLNLVAQRAYLGGEDMNLQPKEYAILLTLMQSEGKSVSAERLYETAWNQQMAENAGAIQFQISNLRKKLEGSGYTIPNKTKEGYTFERSLLIGNIV